MSNPPIFWGSPAIHSAQASSLDPLLFALLSAHGSSPWELSQSRHPQPTPKFAQQLSWWPRNSWKMEQTWKSFVSTENGQLQENLLSKSLNTYFPVYFLIWFLPVLYFLTLIFLTCLSVAYCSPRRRSWRRTSTHNSSMMANCSNWPLVEKRFSLPPKKMNPSKFHSDLYYWLKLIKDIVESAI